jgi:AraC-like DNA-binding protein
MKQPFSILVARRGGGNALRCLHEAAGDKYYMGYFGGSGSFRMDALVLAGLSLWMYVWGGEVWVRSKKDLYVGYCGPGTVTYCSPGENQRYALEMRGGALRVLFLMEELRPWMDIGEMGPGILSGTEAEDFLLDFEECMSPEMLESEVQYVLGRTGQVYRKELSEKMGTWPWRVRSYLDENYLDPDLRGEVLQEYFGVREYSLRQQFQREFKVSPHEYYTVKRLRYYLENFGGQSPSKCFWKCGYHAESTFRYELKRHGIPYR